MEERQEQREQGPGLYLGEWASVADDEEAGVILAWEGYDRVALGSQGVMQRVWNLQHAQKRSWIEEVLVEQMRRCPKTLMWVKGCHRVKGNEEADRRAGMEVEMGWRLQKTAIATPAGTKQELPIYCKAPAHLSLRVPVLLTGQASLQSAGGLA